MSSRPSLVDRALGAVGLLRRSQSVVRRRSVYAGARLSRLEADWLTSLLSADQELKQDLRRLRARARELARDDPHATGFLGLVRTNVIGADGIRLQARVANTAGRLDQRTNASIESGWERWSEPEFASSDGRLSWVDLQGMAARLVAMDGEALLRIIAPADNEFGFTLQLLDADQLDETYNRQAANGVNEIRMGVELGRFNKPVAYHLWSWHPTEYGQRRERIRVDAREIVHLFVSLRPGQTRGVPWLTPILLSLRMMNGYAEAELVAARGAAAKPVFFEVTPEGAEVWSDPEAADTPLEMEIEPGLATQLPFGLKANQLAPQHPTTAFGPFQKSMLRTIASGLMVSYNSLANDLEGVNYSSMRGGLLLERDVWRTLQRWVAMHLHRRVYRNWLPMAALMGQVQLPTAEASRWTASLWMPRGWKWVDPLNDVQTAEREIRLGVNTRTALCAEQGRDYEEVLATLKQEQEMADELGVDVSGTEKQVTSKATDGESDDGNAAGKGGKAPDDVSGSDDRAGRASGRIRVVG